MKTPLTLVGALLSAATITACDIATTPNGDPTLATTTDTIGALAALYGVPSALAVNAENNLHKLQQSLKPPTGVPALPDTLYLSARNPIQIASSTNLIAQAVTSYQLKGGTYDCTSGTCPTTPTASDDLIYKWKTPSGQTATMLVDWDGSTTGTASPAVDVVYNEIAFKIPTKIVVKLTAGNATLVDAQAKVAWRAIPGASGKYAPSPDNLSATAVVKDTAGKTLLNLSTFDFKVTDTDTTLAVKVTGQGSAGDVTLDANLDLKGKLERDASGLPKGFAASTSDSTLKLSVSTGELNPSLDVALSNIKAADVLGTGVNYDSIKVKGKLTVGSKHADLDGTFDDADKNCVPGDHMNLTIASGKTTVAEFLAKNLLAQPCKTTAN